MTRNKYIFYTQEEIETYQMFRLTKFVMFSVLHCEKKRVFMRFALNHCIFFLFTLHTASQLAWIWGCITAAEDSYRF